MKIYHVETQESYDELMIELEEKGYKWLNGSKPTFFRYWEQKEESSCIKISGKDIAFMDIEQCKKQYPDTPIIECKAKGENITQEEIKQKEIKQNIFDWARDVSVAVESFTRDMSEAEADLQEAKSSAKKLIKKIDEYLESLKPKFKVGDYVTVYVNGEIKNAKIEKIDEVMENNLKVHGLWYDRELVNVKQDYLFTSGMNKFRHARPTEIKKYESALTFHKHGRKPFEVKKGDILRDDEGNILINDDNILPAEFPKNLKKDYFVRGRYTLLKTVEEVNEWLENK